VPRALVKARVLFAIFSIFASILGFARKAGHAPAPAPTLADSTLIDAALRGERTAVRRLMERLTPVIRARVLRLTRGLPGPGGHDADDLISEVWARLLENDALRLRAFDPTRGKTLEGFVSLIAGQLVITEARAARAEKRGSGRAAEPLDAADSVPAAQPDAEGLMSQAQGFDALWAHLEGQLSDRGRLVLRLVYVDGLSVPEAAAALGVTAQVVYNWQFKIRGLAEAWRAGAEDPGGVAVRGERVG
jgi:RNA polymerase sigma factor (sigma-70 family)